MPTIVKLYVAMRRNPQLQKNWEQNQPRTDRVFEAPLIARSPREVATAALLAIKLKFEPAASAFVRVAPDPELAAFGRSKSGGRGGTQLANIIEGQRHADDMVKSAAIHALHYYRCRSDRNELVRLPWSETCLQVIGVASPTDLINPALGLSSALRKAKGVSCLALLLVKGPQSSTEEDLRRELRAIPGLGPERADAVGVFGFQKAWPIVDEYLWTLLGHLGILTEEEKKLKGYDRRRRSFEPYWRALLDAGLADPNEIAATLYLWADETVRFGYELDWAD